MGVNCRSLINTGPRNPSPLIDTNTLLGDHFVVRGKGKLRCMSSRGGQTNEAGTTISKPSPAIKAWKTAANHEYSTNFSDQAANMVSCAAQTAHQQKERATENKTAFAMSSCHSNTLPQFCNCACKIALWNVHKCRTRLAREYWSKFPGTRWAENETARTR